MLDLNATRKRLEQPGGIDDLIEDANDLLVEVERLRAALRSAERQTVDRVPEKREHCYICAHVGPEEAIVHDSDCPFALLKRE